MGTPLRVLIIEDSVSDVALIVRYLSQAGFEPVHRRVETAVEMREALDEDGWELIIADYSMPRFDASRALEIFKERGLSIPFIVVSGSVGEEIAVQMMKDGAHDYLLKDNMTRFVPAVQRELREARERRERRQTEEALEASETKYRLLFESMRDALVVMEMDGLIVSFNDAFQKMVGYEPDEIRSMTYQDLTPEKWHAFEQRIVETQILPQGYSEIYQKEYRRKDGTVFPVELRTFLLRDKAGAPSRMWAIVRDITERKNAEESLRTIAKELAQSNQELEQFAYVASHDLQEPLRAVTNYLGLLQARMPGQLDAKSLEYMEGAVQGAKHLHALVSDLLALSCVGRRGKQFEPGNLDLLLSLALTNLSACIQESQARITHDPLPTLEVDSAQIVQLFQNLVSNALKFHGNQPPVIHIGAEQQPGQWLLSVRDNGIGIEPQYFDRIFLIFKRLHTRKHYPGTGIGLAICKKVVERHGGRIWVESQPGQGSTFFFTLPLRSPAGPASS